MEARRRRIGDVVAGGVEIGLGGVEPPMMRVSLSAYIGSVA
jgi:hypothetical protein